jgi:hypothetical protein
LGMRLNSAMLAIIFLHDPATVHTLGVLASECETMQIN